MNPDQITFTLKDIAIGVTWILTVVVFWLRIRKLTKNDLGELATKKDVEGLGQKITALDKDLALAKKDIEEHGKDIETLFRKVNSK